MKSEKEEIDQLIEQALSEEEAALYHKLDEQSLMGMMGGLFQGKMKWLNTLTIIAQLVMSGFAVYFAIKFFYADDLKEMIKLGASGFFFILSVVYLKTFHLMEIEKNAIIREVKRLELQISVLASNLSKK
ncbi:MAG: hypothetical protein KI790_18295 [Cyclobacteriaceae bacterium]|nr:hypothetical protein [Cyclobacteriaceae bacterium HetDA_MAG_MS6]